MATLRTRPWPVKEIMSLTLTVAWMPKFESTPVRQSFFTPDAWLGRMNSASLVSVEVRAAVPKPLMVTVGPVSWAFAWMAKLAAESAASALHILFIVMLSPVVIGGEQADYGAQCYRLAASAPLFVVSAQQ